MVEDDPDILELVQGTLEDQGYEVAPANSLSASLTLLEEQPFHFVLTDLFYQRGQDPLQSIEPLLVQAAPIPVGVMTAWQIPEEAVARKGLACLLTKPFELDTLVQSIEIGLQATINPRERHSQLIEQFFAALNTRNWERLARLCAPDVTVMPVAAPFLYAHALPGHARIRGIFESRFLALPGFTIESVDIFARPVGLAARYIARWQGSDGVIHHVAGAMQFRFRGGHIAHIGTPF